MGIAGSKPIKMSSSWDCASDKTGPYLDNFKTVSVCFLIIFLKQWLATMNSARLRLSKGMVRVEEDKKAAEMFAAKDNKTAEDGQPAPTANTANTDDSDEVLLRWDPSQPMTRRT